jgi:8-oxo-dGTP pyrophosphatase MutT (NUDIX family)
MPDETQRGGGVALPIRHAVRVLLIDARRRTLWFRHAGTDVFDPTNPARRDYWAMPGGGLEPGEDHEEAAHRELAEELGLVGVSLSRCFADRRVVLNFCGTLMEIRERFFWANWSGGDPECVTPMDPSCIEHRWWDTESLEADSGQIVPRGIAPIVRRICAGEAPGEVVHLFK